MKSLIKKVQKEVKKVLKEEEFMDENMVLEDMFDSEINDLACLSYNDKKLSEKVQNITAKLNAIAELRNSK